MKLFSLLTGELAGAGSGSYTKQKRKVSEFRQFVFQEKTNRQYLLGSIAGSIVIFIFFKILYPFPDFISDSYSYIDTNLHHMRVNLWPIGYSKYLLFVHQISSSDTFLIFTQYALLQASLIYFFFSFLFLYKLSKKYVPILFVFLFFNPVFIYLCNCVLSDAIFCSISIVLVTQYLWLFKRTNSSLIITHAVLIGIAFTIRYTAMYYPIIGAIAFLLSKQTLSRKILGILSPWLIIIPFILYTREKTKEITGTAEFSVFGGWQLANNALYMYDHIQVDTTKLPVETQALDQMARSFFHRIPPERRRVDVIAGTFFIKVPGAILKPYMIKNYKPASSDPKDQFLAWGKVSPTYNKYGTWLIQHYPIEFAKYYLWLNTQNYFIPYLEKFESYNLKMDEVLDPAKDWFRYKESAVESSLSDDTQKNIFFFYPPFFMMLNLYFAGCLLYLFFSRKLKSIPMYMKSGLVLITSFLFINFCFSVFATPIVLRYQVLTMILLFSYSLYFTEKLDKEQVS